MRIVIYPIPWARKERSPKRKRDQGGFKLLQHLRIAFELGLAGVYLIRQLGLADHHVLQLLDRAKMVVRVLCKEPYASRCSRWWSIFVRQNIRVLVAQ